MLRNIRHYFVREDGAAIILIAIVASTLVVLTSVAVLLSSDRANKDSVVMRNSTQALVASESGLEDALDKIQHSTFTTTANIPVKLQATESSPATAQVSNGCYSYWFGYLRDTNNDGIPDVVTVHVTAASPYTAPANAASDCDVRQVVGGQTSNIGTLNLIAEVSVANVTATTPPRVLNINYNTRYSDL